MYDKEIYACKNKKYKECMCCFVYQAINDINLSNKEIMDWENYSIDKEFKDTNVSLKRTCSICKEVQLIKNITEQMVYIYNYYTKVKCYQKQFVLRMIWEHSKKKGIEKNE